jgi:ElaA protein
MHYQVLPFSELTNQRVYEMLQLRSEVFVVEQTCIYQDMDNQDLEALHVLGIDNERIVSYARILTHSKVPGEVSIGRVIVSASLRGTGEGHRLMAFCMNYVQEQFNHPPVRISAQAHLVEFYAAHGFNTTGNNYLEDGIPHCEMLYTP